MRNKHMNTYNFCKFVKFSNMLCDKVVSLFFDKFLYWKKNNKEVGHWYSQYIPLPSHLVKRELLSITRTHFPVSLDLMMKLNILPCYGQTKQRSDTNRWQELHNFLHHFMRFEWKHETPFIKKKSKNVKNISLYYKC